MRLRLPASLRPLLQFSLALVATSLACAQTVRWQPAGGTLARGQVGELGLIFENCEPTGDVALPIVPNLEIGPPTRGEQTSMNIINGRTQSTRSVWLAYAVRPLDDGPVTIPAFTVETDQGPLRLDAITFTVREATLGNTAIPISQVASSALAIGRGPLWAGEVVPVDYTLSVSARFRANLGGDPVWEPAPLVVEAWSEPTRSSEGSGADARALLTYSTRGYVRDAGTYAIPSVQQLVNIGVPMAGLFSSLRAEQYAITSESPQLVVRPLPAPAPEGFNGAVGSFRLASKVVPESATVGEPITWTLTLEGTGNWPDVPGLPAREVSRSFRVVQPQAARTTAEGRLFEGSITEDVVLIPTQPGDFTLGPVTWSYFDPAAGRYQTVSTPAVTLHVAAAAAAAPIPSPVPSADAGASVASSDPAPATPAIRAPATPAAPSAIPLDPLPGDAVTSAPVTVRALLRAVVALLMLVPIIWFALATHRALVLDPGRPARLARHRLTAVLGELRSAPDRASRDPLLLAWQRESARLWRIDSEAPTSARFAAQPDWNRLWRESDRALYGTDGDLAPDWADRAAQALARRQAPRFAWWTAFAPRHLFPVLLMLTALVSPTDVGADPVTAYNHGAFAEAEKAWREVITAQPTDWHARHNLALALAQKGRWDEAGAHAAAAFVQQPNHPSVRWHLGYTLDRGGFSPPVLGRFVSPGWREHLARVASPARWQHLLLAGVLFGVGALTLVLLHAYGFRVPAWRGVAWTGGALAVALMSLATFNLQTYGLTADPQAVLVWRATELRSIPTELETGQQTSPLAAGSLARVEKRFLGWTQLAFPNGQTGWVRQSELVGLWTPPS